jgi:hypothetical protein
MDVSEIVGRWVPAEVEYLPVEDGEDDGGFSDEGEGETMSAADLGLNTDWIEFSADGAFRGSFWGSEETGSWQLREGALVVARVDNEPVTWRAGANALVRPSRDEEHGRSYEVRYIRS